MTQNCGLKWRFTEKNGYNFEIPKFKKYAVTLREQSFNHMGPRLYNSLPLYLRQNTDLSLEKWKTQLDDFLCNIPDHPTTSRIVSGLSDLYTAKPTNSILRWIPHLGLSGRSTNISILS